MSRGRNQKSRVDASLPGVAGDRSHEGDNAEVYFEVEEIVSHRTDEHGKPEYLVHWTGYDDPNDHTWEDEDALENVQQELTAYNIKIVYVPGFAHSGKQPKTRKRARSSVLHDEESFKIEDATDCETSRLTANRNAVRHCKAPNILKARQAQQAISSVPPVQPDSSRRHIPSNRSKHLVNADANTEQLQEAIEESPECHASQQAVSTLPPTRVHRSRREYPYGSWEDMVNNISSLRQDTQNLDSATHQPSSTGWMSTVTWKDEHKSRHDIKTLRDHCPKLVCDLFIQHLSWMSNNTSYHALHDHNDDDDDYTLTRQSTLADDTEILNNPEAAATQPDAEPSTKPTPVTWSSLPRKSQLAILTICRLSEPLTQTSLSAYMYYQLKSFKSASGETPTDDVVSQQVGILAAAFTGAQFMTAIAWGRAADSWLGRKKVILVGLTGTAIGSLGFGFSSSFVQAVFWRCVGGMLNGNVGVMRTMISEIVQEKRFQSRAFLLMPMTFNIGVILGPLLGGLLADPVASYPWLFGPGSALGGQDGVWWLTRWPYALPNVVSAVFLTLSVLGVALGLEETLESLKDKPDYGLRLTRWIGGVVFKRRQHEYTPLGHSAHPSEDFEMELDSEVKPERSEAVKRKLPFRRIWTANVLITLVAHGLVASHVGTFNNLWFVFLSTPRYGTTGNSTLVVPIDYHEQLPFTFTGGLALPPPSIGAALAVLGVIGIAMQLLLYPRISFAVGTISSYRWSLLLFPFTYFLTPYLSVIPSTSSPPHQANGPFVWMSIILVLTIQVTARTFALPATAILVNNACPHPSVLGSMHGIAQSVSAATRTVGPLLAGWGYGQGLKIGVIGLAWWCLCGVAIAGAVAGRWVKEGDGHEILLEGETK